MVAFYLDLHAEVQWCRTFQPRIPSSAHKLKTTEEEDSVVISLSDNEGLCGQNANIIEHLLHESNSQATIDSLLYVAMSIYSIIREDCAVSHNIDTVGISYDCRIACIF